MSSDYSGRPGKIKLGDSYLDVSSGVVSRPDHSQKLSPHSLAVLILLTDHHGSVVTRDQFMGTVWNGRIVTDSQLTKSISEIRSALGDDRKPYRYIETLSKRGYRLVCEVTAFTHSEEFPGKEAAPSATERRKTAGIAVLAILVAAVASAAYWVSGADERLARSEGIAELDAMIGSADWEKAYLSAIQLQEVIPNDPELSDRWRAFSWRTNLITEPAGALIYRKAYRSHGDHWQFLGTSPLVDVRVPYGFSVIKAELEGYEPVTHVIGGNLQLTETLSTEQWKSKTFEIAPERMRLDLVGSLPEGKVRVPGWSGVIDGELYEFADFYLDRFEVTNRQYKEFVDAGGYQRREYWQHPIVQGGKKIAWESAMGLFVDRTGKAGPSTWSDGNFPEGQADHPVGGVSWYEAAAYALFRRQDLPSIHHWQRAFSGALAAAMIPESNVDGDSTVPIGTTRSRSWAGNFDMAGNVREWVFNTMGSDSKVVMGGAWNEDAYRVTNITQQPALNRDSANGLRLAILRDDAVTIAATNAARPDTPLPDVNEYADVSDEVFEAYRLNYLYDSLPLNATAEIVGTEGRARHEVVNVDVPYSSLRLPIHLYIPESASPPYQVVVYWPGSIVQSLNNFSDFNTQFNFILNSGRAVAFPVYYSAFGRQDSSLAAGLAGDHSTRAVTFRSVQDLRRTLDYLWTRPDIDTQKIGFFGNSWGGSNGAIASAVDPRFQALVLYTPGLSNRSYRIPDSHPLSFYSRISSPTLQISGEYDPIVPFYEVAAPAFELIDLPEHDKRIVVEAGGHYVPRDLLVRESLDWFDRYLGSPLSR